MAFWDTWFKPKKPKIAQLTPKAIAATKTPAFKTQYKKTYGVPYKPGVAAVSPKPKKTPSPWSRTTPTPQRTTGAVGGRIAAAQATPSIWDRLLAPAEQVATWARERISPTPAQLAPGVGEAAARYALDQPTAPSAMAWARTLPSGVAGTDEMRRQMAYHANLLAAGYTPQEAARIGQQIEQNIEQAADIRGATPERSHIPGVGFVPYDPRIGQAATERAERAGQALDVLRETQFPEYERQYTPEMFGAEPAQQPAQQPSFMETLGQWLRGEQPTAQAPSVTPTEGAPSPWQRIAGAFGKPGPFGVTPVGAQELGGEAPERTPPEGWSPRQADVGLWEDLNRFEQVGPERQAEISAQIAEGIANNTLKDATGRDLWPELVAKNPDVHLQTNFQMVLNGTARPDILESMDGESMVVLAQNARNQNALDNLDISEGYLTKLVTDDEWSYSSLHDMGYKSQEFLQGIEQGWVGVESPVPVNVDSEMLQGLSYFDIKKLTNSLEGYMSEENLDGWENSGVTGVELQGYEVGFDDKGNPVVKAWWDITVDPDLVEQKRQELGDEEWLRQQNRYQTWYWSQEQIDNRRQQWEERYEWEEEKREEEEAEDLADWTAYYEALEALQLDPLANEHFENSAMFTQLYRKWKATGADQTWSDWLAAYDFEADWYALEPGRRGERAGVMAPRYKRLTY